MFLANLLIASREGLEASLVVGIIAAYLVRCGRRDVLPRLWLGVGIAALIPLAVGAALTWGPKTLTFQAQETIGATFSLIAVGLITWMIFWVGKGARQIRSGLESSLSQALDGGSAGWGVITIAIVAVGREGLETALFVWATVRSSVENSALSTTAGVVTGLVLAFIIGAALYRGAVTLNLSVFFTVTGYGLILVAAGVIAYAIHDFQEAGVLPGLMAHAWDLSAYLPAGNSPLLWIYTLTKAVFQFDLTPSIAQVVVWCAYAIPVLWLFTRSWRGRRAERLSRQESQDAMQESPQPASQAFRHC